MKGTGGCCIVCLADTASCKCHSGESEIDFNARVRNQPQQQIKCTIFYEDVTRGLSLVLTILPKGPYSCKAFKTKAYLSSWGKSLSCNAAANILYIICMYMM